LKMRNIETNGDCEMNIGCNEEDHGASSATVPPSDRLSPFLELPQLVTTFMSDGKEEQNKDTAELVLVGYHSSYYANQVNIDLLLRIRTQ